MRRNRGLPVSRATGLASLLAVAMAACAGAAVGAREEASAVPGVVSDVFRCQSLFPARQHAVHHCQPVGTMRLDAAGLDAEVAVRAKHARQVGTLLEDFVKRYNTCTAAEHRRRCAQLVTEGVRLAVRMLQRDQPGCDRSVSKAAICKGAWLSVWAKDGREIACKPRMTQSPRPSCGKALSWPFLLCDVLGNVAELALVDPAQPDASLVCGWAYSDSHTRRLSRSQPGPRRRSPPAPYRIVPRYCVVSCLSLVAAPYGPAAASAPRGPPPASPPPPRRCASPGGPGSPPGAPAGRMSR